MLLLVNRMCQISLIGNIQVKSKFMIYQTDLDKRLKSFTLPKGIISCKETSTCSHRPEIATFHDNIVTALLCRGITKLSVWTSFDVDLCLYTFQVSKILIKHHPPFLVGMQRWTMLVNSRYTGIIFGYNVIGHIVAIYMTL